MHRWKRQSVKGAKHASGIKHEIVFPEANAKASLKKGTLTEDTVRDKNMPNSGIFYWVLVKDEPIHSRRQVHIRMPFCCVRKDKGFSIDWRTHDIIFPRCRKILWTMYVQAGFSGIYFTSIIHYWSEPEYVTGFAEGVLYILIHIQFAALMEL